MNKKEKILNWLKEHDVIEQFYNNFQKSPATSLPTTKEFIGSAFIFTRTPEGSEFWEDISMKYVNWYYKEFSEEFVPAVTVDDVREFMEQENTTKKNNHNDNNRPDQQ